jgi:hypothetical protein
VITLKIVGILLANLPQILKLIEEIERARRDARAQRKVADDLKAIQEAFKNRDPGALRRVFES